MSKSRTVVLASCPCPWAQRARVSPTAQGVRMLRPGPVSASRCSSSGLWARLPLPCRGLRRRRRRGGEFLVSQAFAGDATSQLLKAYPVVGLAGVEAEYFLVKVAEQ